MGRVDLRLSVSPRLFQLGEIKQARALSTDLTAQGAFLYDLLAKEPDNKVCLTRILIFFGNSELSLN